MVKRKTMGIGLLELMLALAIIAMMMVAASKYYQSTQVARRVQTAVENVQALYSANERWVQDGHAAAGALGDFMTNGYLPEDFATTANPWGGTITVNALDTVYLKATFSKVPLNDCNNVTSKLDNKFFVKAVDCTTTSGSAIISMNKEL